MFIINNGFLSYKYNDNFIKEYIFINNYGKDIIYKILNTLNNNIDKIVILENPNTKKIIFKILDKDYLCIELKEDNSFILYIFDIDTTCSICQKN